MRCCSLNSHFSPHRRHFQPAGLLRSQKHFSSVMGVARPDFCSPYRCSRVIPLEVNININGRSSSRGNVVKPRVMDEVHFDDLGMNEGAMSDYGASSSEGEDSDVEILVTPINDVDMPNLKKEFMFSEDALTTTAHRFAMLGRRRKKYGITYGFVSNVGLIIFLTMLLALVDWCAWRIVRLPLEPFFFLRPFLISGVLVACAGYISVPLLKRFKVCKRFEKWGPVRQGKKRTPTMGGLFFVPIGVGVALFLGSISSIEVSGAVAFTLVSAAIGLLDDILGLVQNYPSGLSSWTRFFLEVAVAALFSFWLGGTDISSPYGMKMLVPLPRPFGLVNLGKLYLLLNSICFVCMGYGVDLTDGLDGLAAGTAALAFVGMSIAVLPISSNLSVFGASMAGACVGFLMHNGYKATVFMGNIGSLALGGALASMACCSGMFFPLFIASGIFVLESLSVITQVFCLEITKRSHGTSNYIFRVLPLHYHLLLCRVREPMIVAGAYIVSFALAVFAGYVGLISA